MKKVMFIVLSAVVLPTIAELTPEKIAELKRKEAEHIESVGGLVQPPATSKKLVVLDAREKYADVDLVNHVKAAETLLYMGVELRTTKIGPKDSPKKIAFDAKKRGAGAVVLFYECDGDSTMTAYPEDAITLVNCSALHVDTDENGYSRRIAAEFWRSIGFALGAYGFGPSKGSSFVPIYSLKDFDSLSGPRLSPAHLSGITTAKVKLGIYPQKPVPYSRAAHEGWAPPPTNKVQKALFDRFKDPTARFKADFGK